MRTEFVGREREFAVLKDCLAAALAGSPRVAMCRGEPGIGKTRLAEELAAVAEAEGALVVWGLAAASAGAPPYWPWRQVLAAVGEDVDLAGIADEHRLTADLAQMAPSIFATSETGRHARGSNEDRFKVFDAVARLLRQVARDHPLVIILDDAQWADLSSVLLLQHLARSMVNERLLLVVNHRDTEPLHPVLATELPRERAARQVEVRGLSISAVGAQLASLVVGDRPDTEVKRVHARTGGNPFFVGEICRALLDGHAGAAELPVTVTMREATGARLNRLPDPSVRLLQAASIVGREFSVRVVATMVNMPVVTCLAWLDPAVAAGMVQTTSAPGGHRFVHDLVRDAVEAGIGTPDRVKMHRMAADAIEKVHAGQLEAHLSDLARHWAIAALVGQRAQAAQWIRLAAEEAMRRLAYDEAAHHYRTALVVGADELDDVSRCELMLAVVAALNRAGTISSRLDFCERAATLARTLRRPDLLAAAALALEGGESDLESDLSVRRLCTEALGALGTDPSELRARVTANLSTACMYLGDIEAAGLASRQALAMANLTGDEAAMTAALRARQLVCSGPDGIDERAGAAEQLFAIGRESRNPTTQMWSHLWRIDVALQRGDLASVARLLQLLAQSAEEVRGPVARWHLLQCRAVLAQAQARFSDASQLADEALAELSPAVTGYESAVINRAGVLSAMSLHTGNPPETAGLLGASSLDGVVGKELDFPVEGVIFSVAAARLLASVGRLTEARTVYRRLGPPASWRPIPHAVTVCYAFGIGTAIALRASDDVETLRERLAAYRGHHAASGAGCVAYGGPVELYLGQAAAHLGLLDEAVTDLEAAARACASNGAAGFHAEARYELAAALACRARAGDLRRARALAADVGQQAASLGMEPWAERARLLGERLDGERVDPLTPREHEVAALVATGLTNREIATRLYLSERTAQNHVQHILTKLNLPNRSQIAVWITRSKQAG